MLQFAGYTLDIARNSLRVADRDIALRRKSFELLHYLVENPDRLVTKEELLKAIWPNVTVTDEVLTQCVSEIRQAIGDSKQTIIVTVPRRGYRFAAPVLRAATASAGFNSGARSQSSRFRRGLWRFGRWRCLAARQVQTPSLQRACERGLPGLSDPHVVFHSTLRSVPCITPRHREVRLPSRCTHEGRYARSTFEKRHVISKRRARTSENFMALASAVANACRLSPKKQASISAMGTHPKYLFPRMKPNSHSRIIGISRQQGKALFLRSPAG